MLKLMVVDDEQIVLDAVRFIIEHDTAAFTLVATAKSGREAILKAEQVLPDLILMDIKMPGINGLEAIREIRQRLPGMKFIVISAYEQFQYAREAIELGVLDYIVKPLKRQTLVEKLSLTAAALDSEKTKRQRDLENMEKLEKLLPVLEQGFIHAILLHRELGGEIEKYRDLFDLSASHAYMLVLEFHDPNAVGSDNAIGSGILGQNLLPTVYDLLKKHPVVLVGPMIVNRIVACIMTSDASHEYGQRLSAINRAAEVADALSKITDLVCCIGIGGLRPVNEMGASMDEAIRALHQLPEGGIMHIMDVNPDALLPRDLNHLERLLTEKIEYGEAGELDTVLDQVFSSVDLKEMQCRNKLIEWVVVAHRIAMENNVQEDSLLNYQTYLAEMPPFSETQRFQDWCMRRFQLLASRIHAVRLGKTSKIIEAARKMMDTEYPNEISLESISSHVNISPRYFSKLFKEETGTNFIDYLTNLRMNRAKELMTGTDKSIKEICYAVGYADPNYFSRLFKKQTGLSPTEFQGGKV